MTAELSTSPGGLGRRLADRVLMVAFLAAIVAPAAGLFRSGADDDIAATEQRRAAAFPELEFREGRWFPRTRSLEQFPRRFEAWLNDHLGFRRPLVQAYNLARITGLSSDVCARPAVGESAQSPVIIGRDGWLFFSGEHLMEDYRRTHPFSPQELEAWAAMLHARRDWLEARGIRYIVVIAPNAQSVYPEFMPRSINRVGTRSRLDQLSERLGEEAEPIEWIDLRAALADAKSRCRTYHKTDTHWNEFGAFVGYSELMDRLKGWFPELRPWSLSDFDVQTVEQEGHDLARMLDSPFPWREEVIRLVPRRPRHGRLAADDGVVGPGHSQTAVNRSGEAGRAVVLHDSFALAMMPFLNEHWQRVRYVWTYDFPAYEIEAEQPELVIQLFVERRLMTRPPESPAQMTTPGRLAGADAARH